MHYRAVILVLASNNNEVYKNGRKVWKAYMHADPTIKVYFVYGQLSEPMQADDDDIILDIPEQYPVFVRKTIIAMEIIDSKITYDFFIRTNLTTFWDFSKLHLHLDALPRERCYSGDGPLGCGGYNSDGFYLSGTDTIVTPEMIKSIILNQHLVDYNLVEDAALGRYFHGVLGVPFLPNRICFFEDILTVDETEKINTRIDNSLNENKDHYRVKTLYGDRTSVDLFIYTRLLSKIYNII